MLQTCGKSGTERLVSEVLRVSPETARTWRATKHFDRQRTLSPDNIARLSHEMQKKRFVPGTQIYICAFPDGEEVIINGNHTLEAICHCGIPQLLTVTTHSVADIDEAGLIYAVFDNHKKRSLADSMTAAGIGRDPKTTRVFGAGVACIICGFRHSGGVRAISHVDIIEEMDKYTGAIEDFEELTASCTKECVSFLRRAPSLALCLETLKYQPAVAKDFWGTLAKDSGLCEGMPEHALLRYFRNNASSQNRTYWARASASAWNAKFKGAQITQLRVEGLKKFTILGTPHENDIVKRA